MSRDQAMRHLGEKIIATKHWHWRQCSLWVVYTPKTCLPHVPLTFWETCIIKCCTGQKVDQSMASLELRVIIHLYACLWSRWIEINVKYLNSQSWCTPCLFFAFVNSFALSTSIDIFFCSTISFSLSFSRACNLKTPQVTGLFV